MRPAEAKLLAVRARARLTPEARAAFDLALAGRSSGPALNKIPASVRGVLPVILHATGAKPEALRPVLRHCWITDHATVLASAGRDGVLKMMRAAKFPIPDDVPERVTVWRGAYAMKLRDAQFGLAWTPDRALACYYAVAYWPHTLGAGQIAHGPPILIRREIARSQIVFGEMVAGTEYVIDAPPGGEVDGDEGEWRETAWAKHRTLKTDGLLIPVMEWETKMGRRPAADQPALASVMTEDEIAAALPSASMILPGLWISDARTALQAKTLGIPTLNVREELVGQLGGIAILDEDGVAKAALLDRAAKWIAARWYENGSRNVLVHCWAGEERSPLAVVWFLHRHRGMSFDDAYALVLASRAVATDCRAWLEPGALSMSGDVEHASALALTGFWGAAGAGCIFMAQDTGRLLLAHRSAAVREPGTWGTWGGAIDAGETPEEAVRREARQEVGEVEIADLRPLFVFRKGSFAYHNFLAVVPGEFVPTLNWESQSYRWCEFGDWPAPLHFGLRALIEDEASAVAMRATGEKLAAA